MPPAERARARANPRARAAGTRSPCKKKTARGLLIGSCQGESRGDQRLPRCRLLPGPAVRPAERLDHRRRVVQNAAFGPRRCYSGRTPPMASAGPSDTANPAREQERDISHAARSGGMQVLTVAAQALLSVTHVLLARFFGRAVFGSYQACLAILELVTRGGTGGAGGGMLRYVAAHRARGEEDNVRSAVGTGLRICLIASSAAAAILLATAGPLARLMREPA